MRRFPRTSTVAKVRTRDTESGADALPPSTHPKLGVTSRHQRFHRYALQRIFRPSLRGGGSD